MAVLRIQILKLLLISCVLGFFANNVNGATSSVPTQAYTTGWASTTAPITCPRPTFTNPYAIVLTPDQPTYNNNYGTLQLNCTDRHTPSGLPPTSYCYPEGTWDPDPTGGLCYAQCNTTALIVDDDIKATDDDGELQTVFVHGTKANFECTDEGQFSGSLVATCENGTLDFVDEPTCLAYCPINLQELGEGLYYDIAGDPVINETNTFYYRDEDVITYRCLDGYGDPIHCTLPDCTSTCDDGTWDPPDIPICVVITTSAMTNTTMTTDIMGSPGTTSEPDLATSDQNMTTVELTTGMSMPTTAMPDQTTIAATSSKAFTTDAITTSPLPTSHVTTLMASTDSSTTSSGGTTGAAPTPSDSPTSLPETTETEHVRSTSVTTKPTDKQKTEQPPTTPDVWKVVVGVTVPIVSLLIITAVCFLCWQHRRLGQTSPASASTNMKTYPYEDETDAEARPGSTMIMNNNGTAQEVVVPCRDVGAGSEFVFAAESDKGRTQMLPTVDCPQDYGSSSYEDPPGNIVSSL